MSKSLINGKRAKYGSKIKTFFPLKSIQDVVNLFKFELIEEQSPNLALLSIVIGYIEAGLTLNKIYNSNNVNGKASGNGILTSTKEKSTRNGRRSNESSNGILAKKSDPNGIVEVKKNGSSDHVLNNDEPEIPPVHWNSIDSFYQKFKTQVKGSVDLSQYSKRISRDLVKKISDVIWSNLTRTYYKDRAHLQTLHSYITGNKLDCFGVAYAVVAACQVIGLNEVKLALSEDHAWVTFHDGSEEETIEVTWHGKGNEDKRGQSVSTSNCWLYLNGHPVICTPHMAVAALVSAINPTINASSDSEQMALLQQKLLWLLFENGHLSRYPMAVGNLGDLEELCPSLRVTKCPLDFFNEAIDIAKNYYSNRHVYPYTYLAGYLFRNGRFKEALASWAEAASVIKTYNYTRDDEEIYKEFLEIANELIPHVVKVVSAGGCEPSRMSNIPLLQDPDCFASLLQFYDGLCGWEEESSTPVLHIGWAKPFVATISKFTSSTRSKVKIKVLIEQIDCKEEIHSPKDKKEEESENKDPNNQKEDKINIDSDLKLSLSINISIDNAKSPISSPKQFIETIEKQLNGPEDCGEAIQKSDDKIAQLVAKCSEKILNPDYLMGTSSEPTLDPYSESGSAITNRLSPQAIANQSSPLSPMSSVATKVTSLALSPSASTLQSTQIEKMSKPKSEDEKITYTEETETEEDNTDDEDSGVEKTLVHLSSQKMVGLKDLLLAEKLNTSAIQLQLTAQSQVHLSKRRAGGMNFLSSSGGINELDFVATTTATLGSFTPSGQRTSKRIRRE